VTSGAVGTSRWRSPLGLRCVQDSPATRSRCYIAVIRWTYWRQLGYKPTLRGVAITLNHRALGVVIVVGMAPGIVWAGDSTREPVATLEVLLTVSPDLPAAARATLLHESSVIWDRHDVRIRWLPARAACSADNCLRVLVIPRLHQTTQTPESLTVGELLRPAAGTAIAVASMTNARRMVDAARSRAFLLFPPVEDVRLGLVLGRAIAHEIGHYLLNTSDHAARGLMRPRFSAHEFMDPRSGVFQLDKVAAAWVKDRLTARLPLGP